MMPGRKRGVMWLIAIDQLFGGSWGIVEARRKEIENGPYGAFNRVFKEEAERNFLLIAEAAALLDCHESTARRGLTKRDARFIADGLSHRYYKPDVEETKAERARRKTARESAA
jgi:hypothetical protein